MLKRKFIATLLAFALSYLIIPPEVQERAHVLYEPQVPVTRWKVIDEYTSFESCERGRASVLLKAQEFTTVDSLREAFADEGPPVSAQEGSRAFDLLTLGIPISRCVNGIGSALEKAPD